VKLFASCWLNYLNRITMHGLANIKNTLRSFSICLQFVTFGSWIYSMATKCVCFLPELHQLST